jgi:hypothetical protein
MGSTNKPPALRFVIKINSQLMLLQAVIKEE